MILLCGSETYRLLRLGRFPLATMEEELGGNIKRQLKKLFDASIKSTLPYEADVEPLVTASKKFGDYQWCPIFFD